MVPYETLEYQQHQLQQNKHMFLAGMIIASYKVHNESNERMMRVMMSDRVPYLISCSRPAGLLPRVHP